MNKSLSNSGLKVHFVLAGSYIVYLIAVAVGFISHFIWSSEYKFTPYPIFGFLLIVLGTLLAYWAQKSSDKGSSVRHEKKENVQHDHFSAGPYAFTRSPTQYGLCLMSIGLSILYGSLVMLVAVIIAFLLGKFYFIKKEEKHLSDKYGVRYLEYKQKVKF